MLGDAFFPHPLESQLKLWKERKWKSRYCVLSKASPVADLAELTIFKNFRARKKGKGLRVSIEEFCGSESGFCLEKESHTLAVLCPAQVFIFAFESHDVLVRWELWLRRAFGSGCQFKVRLKSCPGNSGLAGWRDASVRLHIQDGRVCVGADCPPRLLGHWRMEHLRRWGPLNNRFCFQVGSRAGPRVSGMYMFLSSQSEQVDFMVTMAASHRLHEFLANRARPSLRPSLPSSPNSPSISFRPQLVFPRMSSTGSQHGYGVGGMLGEALCDDVFSEPSSSSTIPEDGGRAGRGLSRAHSLHVTPSVPPTSPPPSWEPASPTHYHWVTAVSPPLNSPSTTEDKIGRETESEANRDGRLSELPTDAEGKTYINQKFIDSLKHYHNVEALWVCRRADCCCPPAYTVMTPTNKYMPLEPPRNRSCSPPPDPVNVRDRVLPTEAANGSQWTPAPVDVSAMIGSHVQPFHPGMVRSQRQRSWTNGESTSDVAAQMRVPVSGAKTLPRTGSLSEPLSRSLLRQSSHTARKLIGQFFGKNSRQNSAANSLPSGGLADGFGALDLDDPVFSDPEASRLLTRSLGLQIGMKPLVSEEADLLPSPAANWSNDSALSADLLSSGNPSPDLDAILDNASLGSIGEDSDEFLRPPAEPAPTEAPATTANERKMSLRSQDLLRQHFSRPVSGSYSRYDDLNSEEKRNVPSAGVLDRRLAPDPLRKRPPPLLPPRSSPLQSARSSPGGQLTTPSPNPAASTVFRFPETRPGAEMNYCDLSVGGREEEVKSPVPSEQTNNAKTNYVRIDAVATVAAAQATSQRVMERRDRSSSLYALDPSCLKKESRLRRFRNRKRLSRRTSLCSLNDIEKQ